MPLALRGVEGEINRNPGAAKAGFVPTAVDNMSPGHPFIMGLQPIPVVPTVKVNSIIAVDGDGRSSRATMAWSSTPPLTSKPVEAELVVRSSHSAQGNPHTVEEVQRILRLHARA